MHILIAEDNEISANIIDSNLHQRGYDTLVAHNGTEALNLLENHWDIGLVLADIMMPEMDGLELVRRMREYPLWQEIPVIICTSLADSEHVLQAARLGCRHYLLKPIDRVKLIMMVDKLLTGRKIVPVLGDLSQIMKKYSLSSQSLSRVLKAFQQLVDESLSALLTDPANASNSGATINLEKLIEGAITLEAERLLVYLRTLQSKGKDALQTPEERVVLLAEFKLMQRALAAQAASDLMPAASDEKPAVS